MIYDRDNISIPILCPIQFTEPVGYSIYKQQTDFAQPIITFNKIAVLISDTVYNSGDALVLKMYDDNDVLIDTFNFTKKTLSTGYYYATTELDNFGGYSDALVYFEIRFGSVLLANSVYYVLAPVFQEYIKTLKYKNLTNEWDNIFVEDVDSITIPIETNYTDWFSSCVLSVTETKYVVTLTVGEGIIYDGENDSIDEIIDSNDNFLHLIDGNYYVPNFTAYFNNLDEGNIHYVEVTTNENATEYIIEVDKSILFERSINIIIMTQVDNLVFVSSEYMMYGNSFTSDNEFIIDVECGVVPKDQRDEQEVEDYIQQDMVNETIYGELYTVLPVTFGSSKGIPYWLATKINRATLCDEFYINNELYKRVKGSKMEKVDDTENGLGVYKIDFQIERNYSQ